MGKIIAVAGKGGTGKTTVAALVVKALKERSEGAVLAIDADPNSNLGEILGARPVSTIVGIVDDISKNPGQIPAGMTKDRYLGLRIQEALEEKDNFDLLTMGRPEGPGCYCFVNNLLRELIKKLMNNYAYVVVDNEAGMEHFSRRLVRKIDVLFMVSDSSAIGVRSAARISRLADDLNILVKERFLILNKVKDEAVCLKAEADEASLSVKTVLPFNAELEEAALKNKSVFDLDDGNSLVKMIKEVTDGVIKGNLVGKDS